MMFSSATTNKRIAYVMCTLIVLTFGCATASSSYLDPYPFTGNKPADNESFVVMKDGTIIKGNGVTAWTGALVKKVIRLDGREIPVSEIKGFQNKGVYYLPLRNAYAKRLVHGRMNIYEKEVGSSFVTLIQKGDDGEVVTVNSIDQLKEMLADCPKAYNMLNISSKEYYKIIKKQYDYLNTVVQTYNDCEESQ